MVVRARERRRFVTAFVDQTRAWAVSWLLLVCVGVSAGCGYAVDGRDRPGPRDQRVKDLYCSYGARDQAGLTRCLRDVRIGEIRQGTSNAARYARNEIYTCKYSGAGPFCRDR